MQLALGTAQFGLDYGVTNASGKVPAAEVRQILAECRLRGISLIDTASLYGESEQVLGASLKNPHPFKIVTKTPQFKKERVFRSDADLIIKAFSESLRRLKQTSLYALLFHSANDLLSEGGEMLYESVQKLKSEGLIQKIGASIYTADQAALLTQKYSLDIIQLPVSVFDQRLVADGTIQRVKDKKIEIHARSIFLQGLLLSPADYFPDYFNQLKYSAGLYERFLKANRLSPLEGALSFVKSLNVDYAIAGASTELEWKQILDAYETVMNVCGSTLDFSPFAVLDEQMVNPSLWPAFKLSEKRT